MTEPLYTQEQLIQVRNDNYNAGIETERDRIIQLLKDDVGIECRSRELRGHHYSDCNCALIALIKGENK